MFCKHVWEVVTNTKITHSYLPDIFSVGFYCNDSPASLEAKRTKQETHVFIMKCKKCGKIKKEVTRS